MIMQIETIKSSIPLGISDPIPLWTKEYETQLYLITKNECSMRGFGQILTSAMNLVSPYISFVNAFAKCLVGKEEDEVQTLSNLMFKRSFNGGYGVITGAIGGIDISLWDLLSRSKKVSLSSYIGSSNRKVRRYVSLPRYKTVKDTINIINKLYGNGYRKIKMHQDRLQSLEVIKYFYGLYDDLKIMVDLSCTLNEREAVEFMNEASKYEIEYVEEPVFPPDDYELLKQLNKLHPVAGGENVYSKREFQYCIENEIFSVLQPDLTKIGGVTKALEIMPLVKEAALPISFHSRPDSSWIQLAASAQVASLFGDLGSVESPLNDIPKQYFDSELIVDKDYIHISGDGIGVSLKDRLPALNVRKTLVP